MEEGDAILVELELAAAAAPGQGGRVTIAAILAAGILLEAWMIARRA